MKILYLSVITFMLLPLIFHAEEKNETFTISGKVYSIHQSPIYIYLVDEEISKKPFIGVDVLIITPRRQDINLGYINYIFSNVKKGKYGIRCFQVK